MNGNFQVKDEHLLQYFHKSKQLVAQFKSLELKYIPREENARADKLSKLTSGKKKGHLSSMIRQIMTKPTIECLQVSRMADREDWRREFILLIKQWEEGKTLRPSYAKQIARYVIVREELYRRDYVTPMLKCLATEEA